MRDDEEVAPEEEEAPDSGPDACEVTPLFTASAVDMASVIRAGGRPPDRLFDTLLPRALQRISGQHWTPLVVALRAAAWLTELGVRSVVDIGSGAGKLCVAVALATNCTVTGIEQRPRFVEAARDLARACGVSDRVSFIEGALTCGLTPVAEAYYLYNPFGENIFPEDHLDEEVELGRERFERDVAAAEALLRDAPFGTCVITYNGFGGHVPRSYRQVRLDRSLPNALRMWKKVSRRGAAPQGGGPA